MGVGDIDLAIGKATIECISDEALIHLKSYKYSSVDKSPVSKYILGPWVCSFQPPTPPSNPSSTSSNARRYSASKYDYDNKYKANSLLFLL